MGLGHPGARAAEPPIPEQIERRNYSLDKFKIYMLYWGIVYFINQVISMPLYEYQCNECGKEFEKMVRFSEADHSPECPSCHGQDTRKKISSFASLGSSFGGASISSGSNCGSSGGFS